MIEDKHAFDGEVDEVGEVRFKVLSGDDVRAMSCCEVTSAELFNGNTPVPGGLYDPRMGAFDYGTRCQTCHHGNKECPGHFGHIELAAPMFNIELKDCVKKVLKCVCTSCASLMLPPDDSLLYKLSRRKVSNNARFAMVIEACSKIKLCHTCGARKADSVTWDKKTSAAMLLNWKMDGDKPAEQIAMDGEQVESLFRRIPTSACVSMGVANPAAMLLTALPVPPIAVRPPAKNSSGQRRDDDLTIKLSDIIKHNTLLQSRIQSKATAETLLFTNILLQMHCIQYINNTTNGVQSSKVKATNRILRSVTSRLKGKDGRVRGNLCGKRVDQSARSVITPDPNISIEELGMPLRIAKTLTMPEIVRPDNMARLQETIENGPQTYPGAIFVEIAASGSMVHLKRLEARRRVRLEVGDIVHRHLLNGDVVLFNRQPSLHRMSMMAHRVRVMPHDTFRLSVMVTPPYNADFDGDEMNAHCPQSAMTATELRMLSGVASQIITPREHKPIIGVVQDVALGIHLITAGDVKIGKKAACNLLAHLSTCKGLEPKDYTGIEMMSELFPPTLHMQSATETVEYGQILDGRLNKKAYQRATTGVLHTVYNDNGPRRAVRLLDDTQNLSCDWLMMNGFSVGIGDLMGGLDLKDKTNEAVNLARSTVEAVIQSLHDGTFKNESFMSNSDKVEAEAIVALKAMFETIGKVSLIDSDARGSRLMSMINAGSKGSVMNVCQMVGSVGQQEIENHRVPLSFEGRVLPHFSRYDDGGDARGLVASSFLKGLGPKEFFMHAMAGREGLIDTAVKSVTGDTPIVIMEDGTAKYVKIGDWIDACLEARPEDVAHFEERQMELLDIENDIFIPTTDENGVVTWGRVTAMTRHDPGTELYEIKTLAGRSVIVTESKSLLIWHPDLGTFKEVLTPEIKVGDFVPVTATLPDPPVTGASDLTNDTAYIIGQSLAGPTGMTTVPELFLGHVPTEMFVASKDVITGFLKGYFSHGMATTGEDWQVRCHSPRIAEGIAMLCSRLGVFCEVADLEIRVRGKWAERLGEVFASEDTWLTSATDFNAHNDVVLDPITEINIIDVAKYPKVYDLTIPSTLNFGLANGLQVRDTSETGYIQRKLIKALEDCKVSYDRSVRMANGNIVQFLYGEDGMEACAVETQKIPTMEMNFDKLTDEYMFSKCDVQAMHGLLHEKTITELNNSGPELWDRLEQHFRKIIAEKDFLAEKFYGSDAHSIRKVVYHPIAFDRLITGACKLNDPNGGSLDLNPSEALDAIDSLCDRLAVTGNSASPLLMAMIRAFLSPKRLIQHYKMGSKSLKAVVATLEKTFLSSLCSPSEMVGIVAAQSIAEPLTQMVLNTFHSTGVGSATKRLSGVPRIKELIAGTKNPRTPSMTVFLNNNISRSRDSAIALRDKLQTTTIGDIVRSTSLLFDVSSFTSSSPEDARISALYKAFSIEEDEHSSPWMLRMVMNRQKMLEYRVHMHDVHRVLTQSMRVSSVHSDDGSKDLVIKLRPPATSTDMMGELSALEDAVMALTVSGVADVRKAVEQADDKSYDYNFETKEWDSRKDEYVIATQGSNLAEVLSLDAVDPKRTTTNDIMQIMAVLGIEAARTALLEELHEGYSGDSYVNYRHVALLVDFMVQSGTLMAIDRHGINRGDIGPLAKCSFEQPVDNLVRAAVFRETDKVHGVSASIMLGQVARCGTGDGDIILDEEAFLNVEGERATVVERFGETSINEPALDSLMSVSFDRGIALPSNIDLSVSSKISILTASA